MAIFSFSEGAAPKGDTIFPRILIMIFSFSSKELPFFHMFHMNPLHAAENGDITLLKIKNNFKTTVISAKPVRWTADDVFTLNYPGM